MLIPGARRAYESWQPQIVWRRLLNNVLNGRIDTSPDQRWSAFNTSHRTWLTYDSSQRIRIREVGEVPRQFSPSKRTRETLLYDFRGGPLTEPQLKFASTFLILRWVLILWRNISVTSVHYDSIVATLRQIHYVFMDWYSMISGI